MTSLGDGAEHPVENLFSDISFSKWSHLSGVIPSESKLVDVSRDVEARPQIMSLLIYDAFSRAADVIDIEAVEFGKHIGTGASMNVYNGLHKGKAVALKVPRIGLEDRSKQAMASVSLELKVLLSEHVRQHPNIAKLLGLTWINEELDSRGLFLRPILVMELAYEEHPTLDSLIGHLDPHDFGAKGYLISDIVGGLDAIHLESFIVGDLKPENILIFHSLSPHRQYVAKLSDFGYSDDIEVSKPGPDWVLAGTEYWSAPECFASLDPDKMVDVRQGSRDLYSLGLVIWFILGSELPFGPNCGPEWLAKRENFRHAKINDEISELATSFVTDTLSAFNPIFNIANDILDILSVGENIVVPKDDPLGEKEASQWYLHALMSFTRGSDLEDYVYEETFRAFREKGLEWPLPKIHSASAALGQQINFRESLDSKIRCVMVDELLFRRKVCDDI
jgi:serine/threonine protein kinase